MKTTISILIVLLAFMSCSKTDTKDVIDTEYNFLIRDAQGKNLITENSAYINPIGAYMKIDGVWVEDKLALEVVEGASDFVVSLMLTSPALYNLDSETCETMIKWSDTESDIFTYKVNDSENIFACYDIKVNGVELEKIENYHYILVK